MQAVVGSTMAGFSACTGLTPSDAYDAGGRRVFVVLGPSVTLITPGEYGTPTVANSRTCGMLLETKQVEPSGSADSWRILRVDYSRPCAGVY